MKSISIFWRNKDLYYSLEITECQACGRKSVFRRVKCPFCGSSNVKIIKSRGFGTVEEFTISYYRGETGLEAYPRIVAIVKLDEGIRVVGELVDVDVSEVSEGMRVEAVLRRVSSDDPSGIIYYSLKFMPVISK